MAEPYNTSESLYRAQEALREGDVEGAREAVAMAFRAYQRFEKQVQETMRTLEASGARLDERARMMQAMPSWPTA